MKIAGRVGDWENEENFYHAVNHQLTFVFIYVLRLKMYIHFRFVFDRNWDIIFITIFVYG